MKKKIILIALLGSLFLLFVSCGLHNNEQSCAYSGFGIELYLSEDKESYSITITNNQAIFPDEYNGKPITSIRSCSQNVNKVEIPYTITKIEDGAFKGCNLLKSITIPSSVLSIGKKIFENCSSLESVTIPYSIEYLSEDTFLHCSTLSTVTYTGTFIEFCESKLTGDVFFYYKRYSSEDDLLNHFIISTNGRVQEITQIDIPTTITTIESKKFYGFSNVNSVYLHKNITFIETDAFQGCSNIRDVYYEGTKEEFDEKFAKCFNRNITFHSTSN